MYEIMLNLDGDRKKCLYEQIYEYIRQEIRNGKIPCGERLLSTRMLAKQLDVSRSTAQMAYEQLMSEGYIEAVANSGYYVCQIQELYQLDQEPPVSEEKEEETGEYRYDFTPSGIDLDHFPYATWRKLSREVLQSDQRELFGLGDPKGEYPLRKVISTYLYQARGVNAKPAQIVIGAGNDYLQMLLSRMLGTEHRIAMESPGYRHAYDIFQSLGYDCCTVSMDRYGMDVKELRESGADIAYVMPSHQYPMGIVMPVRRRQELLQWAAVKEGRYIIEDDYDSEFRYIGKPIPSLQGSDTCHKVIYIGTFSKSITPSLRISYLVLPAELLDRYEQVGRSFSCTVSRTDQKMLQLFMERGYFERHLNKMRALYRNKHDALLAELRKMQGVKKILGERSGVHLLVQMADKRTEQELADCAKKAGVRVYSLSEYCLDQREHEPMMILGYAKIKEEEIYEAAKILSLCWEKER